MQKFIDRIRKRCTRHREKASTFDTQDLFQKHKDSPVVKLKLQLQSARSRNAFILIFQIIPASCLDSIQENLFHGRRRRIDLVMHTGIYFLPKAGNVTHQCRMHLRQCLLNHLRVLVNGNRHPFMQAIVRPRFLENMSQGKEAHRKILVRNHRQTDIVNTHRFQVIGMMKHDAFRLSGRTGSIYNGSQVLRNSLVHTDFHSCFDMGIVTQPQEIIKINGSLVLRIQFDSGIKYDQALQELRVLLHLKCIVILQLFTDKQSVYAGIINYVFDLSRRICRIHWNRNHPVRIGAKISV